MTPSHHILSSHFTKGRFLCENNEIARKKEQVPDFGWKVAAVMCCAFWKLLVSENASPTNINPRFRLKQQCLKMPNESFLDLSCSHCQQQFIVTVTSVWKHQQSLSLIQMLQRLANAPNMVVSCRVQNIPKLGAISPWDGHVMGKNISTMINQWSSSIIAPFFPTCSPASAVDHSVLSWRCGAWP